MCIFLPNFRSFCLSFPYSVNPKLLWKLFVVFSALCSRMSFAPLPGVCQLVDNMCKRAYRIYEHTSTCWWFPKWVEIISEMFFPRFVAYGKCDTIIFATWVWWTARQLPVEWWSGGMVGGGVVFHMLTIKRRRAACGRGVATLDMLQWKQTSTGGKKSLWCFTSRHGLAFFAV